MNRISLGGIGSIVTGKTPSTKNKVYYNSDDYMFITPEDIANSPPTIKKSIRYISDAGLRSIRSSIIKGESILIGCIGSDMGNVGFTNKTCATNQQINSLTQLKSDYNAKYIYYVLKQMKEYLRITSGGSTTPILPKSSLEKLEIYVQDLPTQNTIANFMSSLDDKIALNNKINAELEQTARLIYDYWFTQFDFPDAQGKPYKSSGGAMVYNDQVKREIPLGWKIASLGDFCDLYQPKTISEKELVDKGKYQVFGANGIVGRYNKYNHENSEIVVTCRGNTCGNILRTHPFSWITGNAMVVRPKDRNIHNEYVYYLLQNIGLHKAITGSAQPQITRANLKPLIFVLPEFNALNRFAKAIDPIVMNRLLLIDENTELAQLRDWLLPMLMTGQVKVV